MKPRHPMHSEVGVHHRASVCPHPAGSGGVMMGGGAAGDECIKVFIARYAFAGQKLMVAPCVQGCVMPHQPCGLQRLAECHAVMFGFIVMRIDERSDRFVLGRSG